jgi:hypothetical protein
MRTASLPEEFSDLEPFAGWALQTEHARHKKRVSSSLEAKRAFYNAVFPRAKAAMAYLDQFPMDNLPRRARNLYWLLASLIAVSFPIEVWKQPKIFLNSGANRFSTAAAPPH